MLGSAQVRDPQFQDRVVAETRFAIDDSTLCSQSRMNRVAHCAPVHAGSRQGHSNTVAAKHAQHPRGGHCALLDRGG